MATKSTQSETYRIREIRTYRSNQTLFSINKFSLGHFWKQTNNANVCIQYPFLMNLHRDTKKGDSCSPVSQAHPR